MAQSVANLLLRITGDEQDAESSLDRLQRELAQFARTTAEADADVDTSDAQAKLNELQRDLSEIDRERATPEVNVGIAQALGRLQMLRARLAAIDRQDIVVDAHVRQGLVNEINAVERSVTRLRGQVTGVGTAARRSSRGFSTFGLALTAAVASASAAISKLILKFGLLSAAIAVVGTGVGVLVGSLGAGTVGLGALVLAFGGAAAAALAFGMGVKSAMKGSAPHVKAVKKEVEDLKQTFGGATAAGAKLFLVALAPAIKSIIPLVAKLKPAFVAFGQGAAAAVGVLARHMQKLIPLFGSVVELAGGLLPPLANALGFLSETILNIASAVMPLLIQQMERIAATFKGWAEGTRNAIALRNHVAMLLTHFRLWAGIIANISRGLGSMFIAAEPQIRAFVGWVAKGAADFAKWAASAEGRRQIRAFLDQALPLIQSLVKFVGDVAKLWAAWAPIIKPVLDLALNVLTWIVKALTDVGNWITSVTGAWGGFGTAVRTAIGIAIIAILSLVGPLAGLIGKITGISTAIRLIKWAGLGTGLPAATQAVLAKLAGVQTAAAAAGAKSGGGFARALAMGLRGGAVVAIPAAALFAISELVKSANKGIASGQPTFMQRVAALFTRSARQAAGLSGEDWFVQGSNMMGKTARGAVVGTSKLRTAASSGARAGAQAAGRTGPQWAREGRNIGGASVKGVTAQANKMMSAGKGVGSKGGKGLFATRDGWKKAGTGVGVASATAVGKTGPKHTAAGKDVANKGAKGSGGQKSLWSRTGTDLAQGLAAGIRDGARYAIAAAESMARIAWQAAKRVFSSRSPSRLFAELGETLPQGLAVGIRNATGQAVAAARTMARKVAGAQHLPGRGGARARLLGVMQRVRGRLGDARGDLRTRLLERLAALRAELEQVARFTIARTRQLTAAVSNMVPALADSVVRLPTVPTVAMAGAGAARGGSVTNHYHTNVSSPPATNPDPEWVAAALTQKMRNRGWTG